MPRLNIIGGRGGSNAALESSTQRAMGIESILPSKLRIITYQRKKEGTHVPGGRDLHGEERAREREAAWWREEREGMAARPRVLGCAAAAASLSF